MSRRGDLYRWPRWQPERGPGNIRCTDVSTST
jgi:hypothetical protein